mmetsp:Transcript_22362/g.29251  ORF Transcript_22362/g.29251 Transcript_22362/m.29251 type:complete len:517 (-) Transcript_22362:360-1910(-)
MSPRSLFVEPQIQSNKMRISLGILFLLVLLSEFTSAFLSFAAKAPPRPASISAPRPYDVANRQEHYLYNNVNIHVQAQRKPYPVFQTADAAEGEDTGSPIPASIFNLVKSIVGAGVLALPGGVAAFSDSKKAMVAAGLLTTVMGLLSAYCFSLIGRVCAAYDTNTYFEAWEKSISPKTAWMPAFACNFKTLIGCILYSIIIGDTSAALASTFNLPAFFQARTNILLMLTTGVIFPLCMLKNLKSLQFTSILGIAGTFYTGVAMAIRLFDGSYAPGGQFYESLAAAPSFNVKGGGVMQLSSLILVSMLSTAFIAHYNAPKFYQDLKNKSVPRYNKVVYSSFACAVLAFVSINAFGFLTFGGSSLGFVLNNYSQADTLITLARVGIFCSILFGYPLVFVGLRDGMLSLAKIRNPDSKTFFASSVGLLGLATFSSLVLNNLGFVSSFGGALFGSMVIYIFPALMMIATIKDKVSKGEWKNTRAIRREAKLNLAIVLVGILLGGVGAAVSVLKNFTKILG